MYTIYCIERIRERLERILNATFERVHTSDLVADKSGELKGNKKVINLKGNQHSRMLMKINGGIAVNVHIISDAA